MNEILFKTNITLYIYHTSIHLFVLIIVFLVGVINYHLKAPSILGRNKNSKIGRMDAKNQRQFPIDYPFVVISFPFITVFLKVISHSTSSHQLQVELDKYALLI